MTDRHSDAIHWRNKHYNEWEHLCLKYLGQKQYNITRFLSPSFTGIYTLAMVEMEKKECR